MYDCDITIKTSWQIENGELEKNKNIFYFADVKFEIKYDDENGNGNHTVIINYL